MEPTTGEMQWLIYSIEAPDACEVYLCGSFNNWHPTGLPLHPCEDGLWSVLLCLAPGRYEYRLRVDGKWMTDPEAGERAPNELGSYNSVLHVEPACVSAHALR